MEGMLFREWFKSAEDIDFQCRIARKGKVFFLTGCYYEWRLQDNSITHQQKNEIREFFAASARRFAIQRVENNYDDLELGSPPSLPKTDNNGRNSANQHIVSLLVSSAWDQNQKGNKWVGIKKMLAAIRIHPANPSLWRGLVTIIVRS